MPPVIVVPYIGTWIETDAFKTAAQMVNVVPYIGTWIETEINDINEHVNLVVPYIGTWIETGDSAQSFNPMASYLI